MRIAEDASADGQDHRPVLRDQGREGRLVVLRAAKPASSWVSERPVELPSENRPSESAAERPPVARRS